MLGSKSTPDSQFQILFLSYGWPSSWALISFAFSRFTPYRGSLLLLRFSCYFFLLQKTRSLLCSGMNVLGFPLGERVAGRKHIRFFLSVEGKWELGRMAHEKSEGHPESYLAPRSPHVCMLLWKAEPFHPLCLDHLCTWTDSFVLEHQISPGPYGWWPLFRLGVVFHSWLQHPLFLKSSTRMMKTTCSI